MVTEEIIIPNRGGAEQPGSTSEEVHDSIIITDGVSLKDKEGKVQTYSGIKTVKIPKSDGSGYEEFSNSPSSSFSLVDDGDRVDITPTIITRTPDRNYNRWVSAYGNGVYVALRYTSNYSEQGTNNMMASTDGIHWQDYVLPVSKVWRGVCYGNSEFIAIGYDTSDTNTTVIKSVDGINWTQLSSTPTGKWAKLTFLNDQFIAYQRASSDVIITSVDGQTWTELSASYFYVLTYGNGKYVGLKANTACISSDCVSWTSYALPLDKYWESICYGDGKFIAIDIDGYYVISSDGVSWQSGRINGGFLGSGYINYIGNKFVVVNNFSQGIASGISNRLISYSIDGITWKTPECVYRDNPYTIGLTRSACYGNRKLVAIAEHDIIIFNDIYNICENGQSITDNLGFISEMERGIPNGLATLDDKGNISDRQLPFPSSSVNHTVITAWGHSWSTQSNGLMLQEISWKMTNAPVTQHYPDYQYQHPCYGNNTFVAVDTELSNIAVSSDGDNWELYPLEGGWKFEASAFGNDIFMFLGYDGTIRFTNNPRGIWQTTNLPGSSTDWRYLTYGNNLFIAITDDGTIAESSDGINWTTQVVSGTIKQITYINNMFFIVTPSELYSSSDGTNWTTITLPANSDASQICYGKLSYDSSDYYYYVLSNDVLLYSKDLTSWNTRELKYLFNIDEERLNDTKIFYAENKLLLYMYDMLVICPSLWQKQSYYSFHIDTYSGDICYGDGKFLIATGNTSIMYISNRNGIAQDDIDITETVKKTLEVPHIYASTKEPDPTVGNVGDLWVTYEE